MNSLHKIVASTKAQRSGETRNSRASTVGRVTFILLLSFTLCGCNLLQTPTQRANALTQDLHRSMGKQDWATIYANADESYRKAVTAEESAQMFAGVVNKLGTPVSCKQSPITLDTHSSAKTITSRCQTTFSLNTTGNETFFWRKSDGAYRLSGYNVTSVALVAR